MITRYYTSSKQRQRHADEYVWRFYNRVLDMKEKLAQVVSGGARKRRGYNDLVAKPAEKLLKILDKVSLI